MGNMLSHLGLSERKRREGRDNARQKWVEGSPGCRDTTDLAGACTHVHVTGPNINVGAMSMMPLQGDSVIRREN